MRDIFLVVAVLAGLGVTLRYPFVGVLIWEWFSLMQPHREAFGFSRTFPLNLAIAVVTILSWLISKEPKRIPPHSIIILLGLFLVWMTFNSIFAFNPAWSWIYWDRTWRVLILGFVIAALATNRTRIEAVIWVAAISLLYYGIKGGLFTVITGGHFKVLGPPSTIIFDNNQMALALLMTLPLVEYLRSNAQSKPMSWALGGAMVLTAIAVLGSYSRGAYIAMAVLATFALFKARRKLVYLTILVTVLVPALYFMPASFYERLNTLNSVDSDNSFQGRLNAWEVAFRYATDHFPFGAGFYGPQLTPIFNHYFPGEVPHAAHSIYFQVLGEHGFIGLIIYGSLLFVSFQACRRIGKAPRGQSLEWNQKLGRMIQTSLIAFLVGGAALSLAYYDLFIVLICLLPQLALLSARAPITSKNGFLVPAAAEVSGAAGRPSAGTMVSSGWRAAPP
jgi:probable O-glycosylation ligase (exosortase A-associated)